MAAEWKTGFAKAKTRIKGSNKIPSTLFIINTIKI
jgi:hypothetical protein